MGLRDHFCKGTLASVKEHGAAGNAICIPLAQTQDLGSMPFSDARVMPPSASCCFPLPAHWGLAQTPWELAPRLAHAHGFFWLDSSAATSGDDAWSYVGLAPERVVTSHGARVEVVTQGRRETLAAVRPFKLLERELGERQALASGGATASGPPFRGGWCAALAYDLGRDVERLASRAQADLPFPDMYLAFHETVLAYEHRAGRWWAACLLPAEVPTRHRERRALACAEAWLERMSALQAEPAALAPAADPAGLLPREAPARIDSNFTRARYEALVARALEYIAAGDIYQVNLSQRFRAAWQRPALELYRALRRVSPARHGAFVHLGSGQALASISPELFLSLKNREVVTRPIKGTRPRGANPHADALLAEELERSAKDRAELTMIVDLERNDLGRVCDYGSVRVVSPGTLERHPTVFHRAAEISGRLHHRRGIADLLRATFPGGSVTGAPKIRAMQIIEELEPTRRGPYCGAIGWIGADGNLELNLAIRTALLDSNAQAAWYQAGGGVVADSDPTQEYEETLAKAQAFFQAVGGVPPEP